MLYYRLKNTIRAVKRQLKVSKLIKNKYIRGKKLKCVSMDREACLRQRYPAPSVAIVLC